MKKNIIAFKNKELNHLATGRLSKTGQDYKIVELTKQQIPEILALQSKVIDDLKPEEKSFVLSKDKDFFEKHFDDGNDMLGIIVDGKLIAQSILLYPSDENPKTGMVDMDAVANPNETSVMQGVLVDADYRGNHLMDMMIGHWMDHATSKGRTHLLSEIETHNIASWASFMKGGMNLHSIGTDPDDGAILYNAHIKQEDMPAKKESIAGLFNIAAKKKNSLKSCQMDDINAQKKLFKKGYVCVAFAKQCKKLTFVDGQTYQDWQKDHKQKAAAYLNFKDKAAFI